MIVVHHLNNSRSQRVLWMLDELELPYELEKYERLPTGLAPAALRDVHPLGKSPVLQDGDVKVAESGAILEYLSEREGGKLTPARGTAAFRDYRYFLHYAEGSLMPMLLMRLVFGRLRGKAVPWLIRPVARAIAGKVDAQLVTPNLDRHVAFVGEHLAKHAWFAGDAFTAADIQMSFPMEACAARVPNTPDVIKKWVDKIHARPAYQRALERGGPYEIMG